MKFFGRKIERPGVLFCVIVVVAAIYSNYGYVNGASFLFGVFATIAIYKMLISGRN